jgi:hypothetical protein
MSTRRNFRVIRDIHGEIIGCECQEELTKEEFKQHFPEEYAKWFPAGS